MALKYCAKHDKYFDPNKSCPVCVDRERISQLEAENAALQRTTDALNKAVMLSEKEVTRLKGELESAEDWNHAVAVCRNHTSQIVVLDEADWCAICEVEALRAENAALKARPAYTHGYEDGWDARAGEVSELQAKLERADHIVKWLLGEEGSFPTRLDGKGLYWWRSELRRRYFEVKDGAD